MSTLILEYKKGETVVLWMEVVSSLEGIDESTLSALWQSMKMAGLVGRYHLVVKGNKLNGLTARQAAVKVVGIADDDGNIKVSFQKNAANAFTGLLNKKNGDTLACYGSVLLQRLKSVTGDSWFDPSEPDVKKLHNASNPLGLVSVAGAIVPVENKPAQAPASTPSSATIPTVGVTGKTAGDFIGNRDMLDLLFSAISEKSIDGVVTSTFLGNSISLIYDVTLPESASLISSIIVGLKKKGLIRMVERKGNLTTNKITLKACKEYGLKKLQEQLEKAVQAEVKAASASVPLSSPTSQVSKAMVSAGSGYIHALDKLAKDAAVIFKAKDRIPELKRELEELEKLVNSAESQAVISAIEHFTSMVKK